jgi:hypothetical protein
MSLFLLGKNNLGDVENIERARKNLGITDLSAQDPSDINITGGSITIDHFCLKQLEPFEDRYVLVTDAYGCGKWTAFDSSIFDSNAILESFLNDIPYASLDWTNEFFLSKDDNLAGLTDQYEAICNLGLDFLFGPTEIIRGDTYQKMNNILLDNLVINDTLEVKQSILYPISFIASNNVLFVDPYTFELKSIELGNDMDDLINNIIDEPHKRPPSMYLLNEVYQNLNNSFVDVNDTLNNLVIENYYLKIESNLADIVNIEEARSNIGLGGLLIDNDNLELSSIIVNDRFILKPKDPYTFEGGRFLVSDSNGEGSWSNIQEANLNEFGLVKLATDYGINPNGDDMIVPSLTAIKAYITTLSDSISNNILTVNNATLKTDNYLNEYKSLDQANRTILLDNLNIHTAHINDFPLHLSAFTDDVGYFRTDNFLSEITGYASGLEKTRSNLFLNKIAWTGSYFDLADTPVTEDFPNIYAQVVNNLSDIVNVTTARANLGLQDLATMSSSDLVISGGEINGLRSITTDEIIFKDGMPDYNNLQNILFLKASSADGHSTWSVLPDATADQKGIITLRHAFDQHTTNSVYTSTVVYEKFLSIGSTLSLFETEQSSLTAAILSNSESINILRDDVYGTGNDGIMAKIDENTVKIGEHTTGIANLNSISLSISTDVIILKNNQTNISNSLNSVSTGLTNTVSTNTTSINTLNSLTNNISNNLSTITGKQDSLSNSVSTNTASINTLNSLTNNISNNVNTITGKHYDLSASLISQEAHINAHISEKISTVDFNHNTLQSRVNENIANVTSLGTSLTDNIHIYEHLSINVSNNVSSINTNISNITSIQGFLTSSSLNLNTNTISTNSATITGQLSVDHILATTISVGTLSGSTLSGNSGVFGELSVSTLKVGTTINTVSLHDVNTVHTYSLRVDNDLQFINTKENPTIPDNGLLMTDTEGFIKWVHTISSIEENNNKSGLTFKPPNSTDPKMQIYNESGKMYISKDDGTGTYIVKHIFR